MCARYTIHVCASAHTYQKYTQKRKTNKNKKGKNKLDSFFVAAAAAAAE